MLHLFRSETAERRLMLVQRSRYRVTNPSEQGGCNVGDMLYATITSRGEPIAHALHDLVYLGEGEKTTGEATS